MAPKSFFMSAGEACALLDSGLLMRPPRRAAVVTNGHYFDEANSKKPASNQI